MRRTLTLAVLFFACYPLGVHKVWKGSASRWKKVLYTVLGFPLFLFLVAFIGILGFAAFLPDLSTEPVDRSDRTIVNSVGNYKVTFLETAKETRGAYELVQVEIAPGGGNIWHYHTDFVEKFHVLTGQLTVGVEGEELTLTQGQRVEVPRSTVHLFRNASSEPAVFTVEINPARSFERTLRIGYGLCNDGLCDERGLPRNTWHLLLLMGYSES